MLNIQPIVHHQVTWPNQLCHIHNQRTRLERKMLTIAEKLHAESCRCSRFMRTTEHVDRYKQ